MSEALRWRCTCVWPDGKVEVSDWFSFDGACVIECEVEAEGRRRGQRVRCQVEPVEDVERPGRMPDDGDHP